MMNKPRKCIICGYDITSFELEFYCPDCYYNKTKEDEYLYNLQWEENMNNLYTYGDDGFCDGFTKY